MRGGRGREEVKRRGEGKEDTKEVTQEKREKEKPDVLGECCLKRKKT